ncbi:MAG TPA: DUF6531 domain-containing protein [Waddliaceae bacterium]
MNAITGDFFDSQVDLVAPGASPIIVQRSWCSADKKWHFSHLPELEVGRSKGENHLLAGYSDDNGMGLFFRTSKDGNPNLFTIPEKVFKKGFTNCGAGEISAQTNWKNAHLVFVRNGLRQFRIDTGSITGSHAPGAPHVHLEAFKWKIQWLDEVPHD